ncbi:MAG: kelch repeat-containing protein [Verrucomicrobiia bacterium]
MSVCHCIRRVTAAVAFGSLLLELGGSFHQTCAAPHYTLLWKQRSDVGTPGQRYGHALAYDSDRGATVLFGGDSTKVITDRVFLSDTWEYDGVTWRRIDIDGPVPSPRTRHSLCYDPVTRQVILFGGYGEDGYLNDVWNYESTRPGGGRWIHRPVPSGPNPLAAHALVYDIQNGVALLAGGTPDPDSSEYRQTSATWAWNNKLGEWTLRDETIGWYAGQELGAGLTEHAMIYDSRRREVIILGGAGPRGTKIVANGSIFWASGSIKDCGFPVVAGAAVYDSALDFYFHFGGLDFGLPDEEYPSDRGTAGYEFFRYPGVEGFPCSYRPTDLNVSLLKDVRPGPRIQCAMIYDQKRRVTVLFGGVWDAAAYNDTWELVSRNSTEIWVDFNYAGREAGTADLPYNTLAEGIAGIDPGGVLKIRTGTTTEKPHITIPLSIEAVDGPVTIGIR